MVKIGHRSISQSLHAYYRVLDRASEYHHVTKSEMKENPLFKSAWHDRQKAIRDFNHAKTEKGRMSALRRINDAVSRLNGLYGGNTQIRIDEEGDLTIGES